MSSRLRRLGFSSAVALAAASLAYPAHADDIPKAPGHRLVEQYAGAPAAAQPLPRGPPPQHPRRAATLHH
ncbi:hypothetical protein ACFWY6_01465, partial [Streptomyces sp. NPDC059037]